MTKGTQSRLKDLSNNDRSQSSATINIDLTVTARDKLVGVLGDVRVVAVANRAVRR